MIGHKGLEVSESTRRMARSAVVAAIANLVLNLIFVPHYGYVAAAYSTLASYALYSLITWQQTRSLVPWNVNLGNVLRYLACMCAASMLATLLTSHLSALPLIPRFLVGGSVFVYIPQQGRQAIHQDIVNDGLRRSEQRRMLKELKQETKDRARAVKPGRPLAARLRSLLGQVTIQIGR